MKEQTDSYTQETVGGMPVIASFRASPITLVQFRQRKSGGIKVTADSKTVKELHPKLRPVEFNTYLELLISLVNETMRVS
jgi:hypothetical protein